MDQLIGTLFGRWYVTLFGLTFLWRASRHLGWRKTGIYSAIALVVGVTAENGSVHFGFPYTRYAFNDGLRANELFIFDVPLMVPLSYTFMAYFAFTAGRLVASGPWRMRALMPWHEMAVAWMLAVWALWILDPVSRLGDAFYLGEVFEYAGPGFWFGLPLGSQLGFALTAAIMLATLFVLDRDAPDAEVTNVLQHEHMTALVTYHAQVFHLAVVAFVINADTIGGSAFLMWIPAALITAVHWSYIRAYRDREAAVVAQPKAKRPSAITRRLMDIAGARVLITGASSGIGAATAELLAHRGATVAVLARRTDRLNELVGQLPGSGHVVVPCDLADLDAAEQAALDAWDRLGHLDVVVHNAAIPVRRHIKRLTVSEVEAGMTVNFMAPMRMTMATLPRMLERGAGCQIYVSSMGGRVGIPAEAAYTASKFALCGWAESLAIDLWKEPVNVRLIIPGPIDTEIWHVDNQDEPDYDGPLEPPSVVADAIAAAIEGDKFEYYAPDLSGVVTWKSGDVDGYLAGAASMVKDD